VFVFIGKNRTSVHRGSQALSTADTVKELKSEVDCSCGCGLTLESCEKYDPDCSVRPGIVAKIEDLAGEEKTKTEILAVLSESGQSAKPISVGKEIDVDDDPAKGPQDAKVIIVEFSDYQCPFCVKAESTVKEILDTYQDKVRFVYRDFPLSFHQYAQKAAEAAECADEQGKFWDYHDLLFEKQEDWSSGGIEKFKEYAVQLGLNSEEFNQCLDGGTMASEVENDLQDGKSYGVKGTPAFFLNGELISGAQSFSVFQEKIDEILE
jgi:protein-disulfide isomerase